MIIKNVKVFTAEQKFQDGAIYLQKGKIAAVQTGIETVEEFAACIQNIAGIENEQEEILDGHGCYAIPGLIDLHFHGCMGHDFCDGTKEAIAEIAKYEATAGVTAIASATMTLPVEELEQILRTAAEYKREYEAARRGIAAGNGCEKSGNAAETVMCRTWEYADLVGINMEGPFISPVKKGAQDPKNIIPCSAEVAERFLAASEGLVKIIGLAPEETADAAAYIHEMKERVNISLAHTNADYESAKAAIDAGANHAVHLYNAMPVFSHRAPGVIGAVAENENVTAELICDGVHIHPAVVRSTFQMFGKDRMILISDSMRATGMPDGRYLLGGLEVDVQGNRAVLVSDGALAGSATNLMDCMRTAVKEMGIPLETAVACASVNPAKKLGIYEEYGSIEAGKRANVVLLDAELKIVAVVKDGKRIESFVSWNQLRIN